MYDQGAGCDSGPDLQDGQQSVYRADDCLLGFIEKGGERVRKLSIDVDGVGIVCVDFHKGMYQSDIRSEADFFTVNPQDAQVGYGNNAVQGGWRPIEELLWKAAYYGSSGRLLEGCNLYDVVELQRWPNFTRLPHEIGCLPLCSLLARRPSSIAFAYRLLRVPPADAMRFYSAARSAGDLRVISAQPDVKESTAVFENAREGLEETHSGFWTRLFGRVVGL